MKKYMAIVLFISCFFISLYATTASGSVKLNDVLMDAVLSDEEMSEASKSDSLSTIAGNLIDYQEIRSSVETTLLDFHAAARRVVSAGVQRAAVLFCMSMLSLLYSLYHHDVSRTFMTPPAYNSQTNLIIKSTRLRN
ncbi:MAG: hypothetical protein UF438_06160 [Oribacterium sp.]|nr:hypothetical protein [Oribacterium sp.]